LYRQAVVLALSGRSAEALASLSEAIRNGYSAPLAREDDDLQALRKVPEFQKLVGSPK
jgi:hypothetical protein